MLFNHYSCYRTRYIHKLVPPALLGHAIVASIVALILYSYSDANATHILIWLGLFYGVMLARITLWKSNQKVLFTHPENLPAPFRQRWIFLFTLGAFLNGVAWGSCIFFINALPTEYSFVLIATTAIVSAVSIGTLGTVAESYIAFIIPANLPSLYWLATQGITGHYLFALGLCVGLSYMILNIRGINSILNDLESTEQSLKEQSSLLREVIDKDPAVIIVKDWDNRFILGNRALANLYGTTPENLVGKTDADFNPNKEQTDFYRQSTREIISSGKTQAIEEDSTDIETGKTHHFQSVKVPLLDNPDDPRLLIIAHDVTDLKEAQHKASESEKCYRYAVEATGEGLWDWDMVTNTIHHNKKWCQLMGLPDQYLDHHIDIFSTLLHPDDALPVYQRIQHSIKTNATYISEHRLAHPQKGYIWVEDRGKVVEWDDKHQAIRMVGSFKDITEKKAAGDEEIYKLAQFDVLTGLPNHSNFQNLLETLIQISERNQHQLALFFIDLDRFKHINDSLGHAVGDHFLSMVADRLSSMLRTSDTLCRLGGDEFVLLMTQVENDVNSVSLVAQKLLAELAKPFLTDGYSLYSSASIGIAIYPNDGADVQSLMKSADTAMYQVKASGRNDFTFFTADMDKKAHQRLMLENDLRKAIENNEFYLQYQPQFDLNTGQIVACEALIRWQHAQMGLISPDVFIPIAEDCGIIIEIGEWVIQEALATLSKFKAINCSHIGMAINISAKQLKSSQLKPYLKQQLERFHIPPEKLELELTETAAMDNPDTAIRSLNELKSLGITLTMDDFGTGYSSLNYLKTMPFNQIKIDRSFVCDIETNPNDAQICLATISLAHSLGLSVVAEGITSEHQHEYFSRHDCDKGQGYLLEKPLDQAELLVLLSQKLDINQIN